MHSVSGLLLLALAGSRHSASGHDGSYDPLHSLNIAAIVSTSDGHEEDHSSTSLAFAAQQESLDFVLLSNTSITNTSLNAFVGYDTAAESKVLYEAATWSLIEDGTEHGMFSSFWARFQAINTSSALSVCTMVAEWNASLPEKKAALSAVEVGDRLKAKCGDNDTIALAFNAAISETVEGYLEGSIAVNDGVVQLKLQDVDSAMQSKASAATGEAMFVRLADGLCPRDGTNVAALSSIGEIDNAGIRLFSGEVCAPKHDPMQPPTSSAESDSSNESEWKRDLRFVIPICICVFLLGCGGLIYVFKQKEESPANESTPKEEEKDDASSLPYVLTMHQVV